MFDSHYVRFVRSLVLYSPFCQTLCVYRSLATERVIVICRNAFLVMPTRQGTKLFQFSFAFFRSFFSLFHSRSRLFYFSLIFHLLGQIMHKFILSLSHKILFHFSLHPSFLVVTARRRKCWPCENTTIVSKRRRHDERMKTLLLLSTNRENFRSSFSFSSARWFYNVFAFSKFPFENEQKARWILFIQCMNSWQLLVKQ